MLNCQVGDLAITVEAELTENIGKIVRVVAAVGYQEWSYFVRPVFLWEVEALGAECPLYYQVGSGPITAKMVGEVPDMFLKPIRPLGSNSLLRDSLTRSDELVETQC
ncbi:MAG: hypothetical protein LRY53_00895 [Burkholderiaceae bacterium]|nr:hypothetical protein [Burkholderiaceae bacterium]MCD8517754.1 hypothetical protein [Burkholderiaceae bacterium]MCD8564236.1 hypothetical protein [Burkholderiaceae bacterium]